MLQSVYRAVTYERAYSALRATFYSLLRPMRAVVHRVKLARAQEGAAMASALTLMRGYVEEARAEVAAAAEERSLCVLEDDYTAALMFATAAERFAQEA